jgi:hypothetical protein
MRGGLMKKITAMWSVSKSFGEPIIKHMLDLFDLTGGTVTEILDGMYIVDFSVSNTVEEITNVENYFKTNYPEIDFYLDIEMS